MNRIQEEDNMRKWSIPGRITGGQCELTVTASTKEDAARLFQSCDWDAESGSWECSPDLNDIDDLEEIYSVIEDCGETTSKLDPQANSPA
jgi:hypothetical protein